MSSVLLDKPVVTIQEGNLIQYTEGQHNIKLRCNAASKPQSTFKWFHAQEEISNTSHAVATNQFIHTINEVNRTHYGDYTCKATNSIASGNDSIHVEVKCELFFVFYQLVIYDVDLTVIAPPH